ncbi:MAG TPA: HAD-IIB family hydrolase [Candidatus Limnocylindria bacterium]|nr:HAD-IIB family hydrolase [Candidatus Limnocylindria bacterium]
MNGNHKNRQLIVITDLDGTLLDQRTYSYESSFPAVRRLQTGRIPIVLCSTKTSAEMLQLWRELEIQDPFICESGGAIFLPQDYLKGAVTGLMTAGQFGVLPLGTDVLRLRAALADAAGQCEVKFRSFGQMNIDQIVALTGLEPDQAFRAWQRQYDEPFLVESGDAEELSALLRRRGLTVTRGDRFYHLTGGHSKRDAVLQLLDLHRRWYGDTYAIGLGNSANDWPMLSAVDRPVLVKNPDGSWDATVLERLPDVERTAGVGPQGWREAIDRILDEVLR